METVNWKVEGMTCANCALSINKYLKEQGLQNVKVNFMAGDVSFDADEEIARERIEKGIAHLGYHVVSPQSESTGVRKKFLHNNFQRFIFCLVFAAPLFLHMFGLHLNFLMNAYVQLALTLPVFIAGMLYFGRSGINSLLKGIPNMDVLVSLGSLASFVL